MISKPHIQKLPLPEHCSFVADRFITPFFETPWHYHKEYELVLIIKGKGKQFIGNHISDYDEGSLIFLGPDLPHLFRKENIQEKGGSLVIHFKEEFLGRDFISIPEMQKINLLLQKSRMGLQIYGKSRENISQKMHEMVELKGMYRLINLLTIMSMLCDSTEYELLSSPEISGQNSKDSDRLNKVFDYLVTNFKEEIQMKKIAEIANMSYSGFCRYFKNRTKKNFAHFVNEIRIGYACKRLMEGNATITEICFESGFNNMANFENQFRKLIKCTPYQFQYKNRCKYV